MKDKSNAKDENSFQIEDIFLDDIVTSVPNPPKDLPFDAHMDFYFENLLLVNDLGVEQTDLLEIVEKHSDDFIRAAAVHTIGRDGVKTAIPVLRKIASSGDSLLAIEATYALFRLGDVSAKNYLLKMVTPRYIDANPIIAMGYLARMGDPKGFKVISDVFTVEKNEKQRVVACKQLYYFLPFESEGINVLRLFELALLDKNTDVQWQALVQLEYIPVSSRIEAILGAYIENSKDNMLVSKAKSILKQ